jgi:AcrR family transcriptional regulator
MDRLGAELGVTGMALYRYVGSKEALLDRLIESCQEELEPLDGALPPRVALAGLYGALSELMCAHPHLLGVLCSRSLRLPALVARAQANIATLVRAGAEPTEARGVLRTLTALTLGYAVLTAGASLAPEERDFAPVLEATLAAMAAGLPWMDRVPVALAEQTT